MAGTQPLRRKATPTGALGERPDEDSREIGRLPSEFAPRSLPDSALSSYPRPAPPIRLRTMPMGL